MKTRQVLLISSICLVDCNGRIGGDDPCILIDCGNGSCVASDSGAQCECDVGYHADGLVCRPDNADADTINPVVANFAVAPDSANSAQISWSVTDSGGSHLDRIEVWRAPDDNDNPGSWLELGSLRTTLAPENPDAHSGSAEDNPGNGVWWYDLRAADQAGNVGSEPAPIRVAIGVCTDEDGDHFVREGHADPTTTCPEVCGTSHNAVCQGSNDCDDGDRTRAWAADCETPGVVAGAYYLTNDGAGSHSGTSYNDAMSLTEHNARVFGAGDTIYVAETITVEVQLKPPSSGAPGEPITYRGDHPDYPGSLQQNLLNSGFGSQLQITNKQYIEIVNLEFRSDVDSEHDVHNRSAINVLEWYEPTGEVAIRGCSFFETCTAIGLSGDVRRVNITKSHFKNLMDNGVWASHHWSGSGYTGTHEVPSFITIGGSRENGNTFVNVGRLNGRPDAGEVPGQVFGTRADDAIFSYNHVYADEPLWGTGVYLNGVDRVLIENNYFHDLASTHRRPHVTIKSDICLSNSDIVIRFNHITHSKGGDSYAGELGISVGNCLTNAVVYGNYLHDITDTAISGNWGWHTSVSDDGCGVTGLYVYANIVARTKKGNGLYIGGSGSDGVENVYFTNNTVYHAVDEDTETHSDTYAIHTGVGSDSQQRGITIKNNVIDTPRDTSTKHIGISVNVQDDLTLGHNHHFFVGRIPVVYMDSSVCWGTHLSDNCIYNWNDPNLPRDYGDQDTEGDPLYVDAEKDDFAPRSESPCVNSGDTLDVSIPSLQIQDETYSFDIADGLDPKRSNWNTEIPFVHTLKQGEHGSAWEKGAYVHPE